MDFTTPHTVGERIAQVAGGGYDHCYVVSRKPGESLVLAARVEDPKSGRAMEVFTTEPGVQLYTANYLSNKLKGGGKPYGKHHALCLEAQKFPNTPNQSNFPTSLVRPGKTYRHVTMHKFSVAK
jgi:aldose 1-epimerase